MPTHPLRPQGLRDGPFRGADAITAGLLTRDHLRSRAWRRVFPGIYVDARADDTPMLRIRAAALRLPPGAVVTGRSAAHVWGAELASVNDPVEVLSPTRMRRVDGIVTHTRALTLDEITTCHGVPVPTPLHTAWEVARASSLLDAVGWLDALARRTRLAPADLVDHAWRHLGEAGARAAATALGLCDPRAESPPESRLRVSLIRAGLPAPVPQFPVIANGHFLARVDLAWPAWRFAVEYDGQWHADRDQLSRDRVRIRNLNAAGWYVYPVTRTDMYDIDRLVAAIGMLLHQRSRIL